MNYACHNKPRPTSESKYTAQKGYEEWRNGHGEPIKDPIYIDIKSAFGTTDCQYDQSATDKRCDGCKWARTG